jgi:hypothetical protein
MNRAYTKSENQLGYIADHIMRGRVNNHLNFNIWKWYCRLTRSVVPLSVNLDGQYRLEQHQSGPRYVYGIRDTVSTFRQFSGRPIADTLERIPNSTTSSVIPDRDIDIKRNLRDVFLRKRLVLHNENARYNLVIHHINHEHLGFDFGHVWMVLRVTDNTTGQTLINYMDIENNDDIANHFFETWFRLQDAFPEFRGEYQSILGRYGNNARNIPYSHINGWVLQTDTENQIACGAIFTMFLYRILNDPRLVLIPFETLKCNNLNPRIGMPMKYIQRTYDLLAKYVDELNNNRDPGPFLASLAVSEPQHINEMTVEDLQHYHNNTLRFNEGNPSDEQGGRAPNMFGSLKREQKDMLNLRRRTAFDYNEKRHRGS